jgi:asparagine synthase (glutamine-hydrolysing)
MCGICGIVNNKNLPVQEPILKAMTAKLIHRGPDESGYFLNGPVGLGMRRLSIIDVAGGHQPIYNEDRSLCVICNGEIYNHLSLRQELERDGHVFATHSDAEVIVHLYENDKNNFVKELRGMFAFAVYDSRNGRLVLVRDRLGIKPLFYAYTDGVFLFASELKSLLVHPAVKRDLSIQALSDYLTYMYLPAPLTIYKNIYKLLPAHTLIFDGQDVITNRYWDIDYGVKNNVKDEGYYEDTLGKLLNEAVGIHLMSEVPLGAFLSGGVDSSVIVALMSRLSRKSVKTFSVGFDVADFNELKYARLVSRRLGTEHHEINLTPDVMGLLPAIVSNFDEPFADSSAIPTYLISEFARKQVTVCLSGDGGDELFCGYEWTRRQKFIDDYNRLPKPLRNCLYGVLLGKSYAPDRKNKLRDKLRRFIYDTGLPIEHSFMRRKTCFSEEMKKNLFKEEFYRELGNYNSITHIMPYFDKSITASDMEKLLLADLFLYLPDDGLCKVDRMSMMHSLEVRVPFLDHKVVEFVASMPFQYKMKGNVSKYILKRIFKDILPSEVLKQRKLGFTVPLNAWFRGKFREKAKEILLSPGCRLTDICNSDFIDSLVQGHFTNKQDFGNQLFTLVSLELWLEANVRDDLTIC